MQNPFPAAMGVGRGYNTFVANKQNKWKPNLIRWVFAISVGVIAYFAAQPYGASAPLGAPLPEVPVLIEHIGVEFEDASLAEGRLNERQLELLAPQSDGVPPLVRPYNSQSAGFTIGHPYGTEMLIFRQKEFLQNGVLSRAILGHGMPLRAISYELPENQKGDKVTVFVSRVRQELESEDAVFLARQGVVQLADYRFEALEYEQVEESGEIRSHFLFFGPFGSKVLKIDFIVLAGQHDLARPYVEKIIRSFEPGENLLELLDENSRAESVNIEEDTEDNESNGDE